MTTVMDQKRKLSTFEHLLEGNIQYVVRIEGSFRVDRLNLALARVQRKHPALRALIREERDGLYDETDGAPEIPLRVVTRVNEDDYVRERETELTTDFAYGQVQWRVVWLQADFESDLLFTASHRICDGMSLFIIVGEVLRSIYGDEELIPYEAVTARDIGRDYQPSQPWKRKLAAGLINGLLRPVPGSRRAPDKNGHSLEWSADRPLLAAFGKKKLPAWIDNQIDPRRGRLAALKSDMLLPGTGGFRLRTGQEQGADFWATARVIHREIRGKIERKTFEIPSRFHFFNTLRPPTSGQVQSIMRLNYALRRKDGMGRFPLSNLGNVALLDEEAPFRLKDLRVSMHSFRIRAVGLVAYTVNGQMERR
jgi:hypothetical protein